MPSGCAPILTSFISITTSSACSRCDENELRTTYAGMLGACEQANLVANEAKLIEPANAIIAFNCHLTHGHAGHAPDGQISHFLSSPSAKNIPLLRRPKSLLYPRHPVPHKGRFAIVTDVGHGMRWTRQRRARIGNRRAGLGP